MFEDEKGVLVILALQYLMVYQERFWKGLESLVFALARATPYAHRQS
jgi:hypothetical protein